jgi:biopolymer transport protein ExbD
MQLKSRTQYRHGLDMAPMVDIVFILVVYFLVNATLVREPVIDIKPPRSLTASPAAPKRLQVFISKDKRLFLNGRSSRLADLTESIRSMKSSFKSVVIKADRLTTYESLVEVMDQVREAGVEDFSLVTEF